MPNKPKYPSGAPDSLGWQKRLAEARRIIDVLVLIREYLDSVQHAGALAYTAEQRAAMADFFHAASRRMDQLAG